MRRPIEILVFANLGQPPFDNNLLPAVRAFSRLGRTRTISPCRFAGFSASGGKAPAAVPPEAVDAALDGIPPDVVVCLGGGLFLDERQSRRFPRRPVAVGIALSDPLGLDGSMAIAPRFDLFYTQDPQTLAAYRERGIAARRLDIAVEPELLRPSPGDREPVRDVIFYGKWTPYRGAIIARLAAICLVEVFAHSWQQDAWDRSAFPPLTTSTALGAEISRSRLALELAKLCDAPQPWLSTWRITYRPFFAAACAVPTLIEDSPRLRDFFEPGVEIATFTNPQSACEVALALLDDEERRRAMGNAARRRLLADHTWDRRARQVLDDVGSIAARRSLGG